jgi:exopolyphosphatase/guanosine-5'-triphosphate,3'-diphosphate pyrophosphatase
MLMLTAEVAPSARPGGPRRLVRTIDDRITFVRLGQGVHQNRAFAPEAMERALKCFREYRKVCDANKVDLIRAVATSASRDAKNSGEFYDKVRAETGIEVQIIEGEIEARLSFLGGLLPDQDPTRTALLDIGGGSTEFVTLDPRSSRVRGQSMDMGCVRATEMFLEGDPYERGSLEKMVAHLRGVWKNLEAPLQSELREKDWTAIAGTPTTLAAMDLGHQAFYPERVDGHRMSLDTTHGWYEKLAKMKQAERAANPLMGTGRSDIMVAGVAILFTALEHFGKRDVLVSTRGLRHGLLLDPPVKGRV